MKYLGIVVLVILSALGYVAFQARAPEEVDVHHRSVLKRLKSFDPAAFEVAQKLGRPIVIYFHATWCPVCLKQLKVLEGILQHAQFQHVVAFLIDFDTAGVLKQQLGVTKQSTVLVFHGSMEKARSVGVADPQALTKLILKGF